MNIDYEKDYYSFRTLNNYCDEAYTCPKCKSTDVRLKMNYCPSCGSKLQWKNIPK
jgi:rRNA maturation endonuclease Nob1